MKNRLLTNDTIRKQLKESLMVKKIVNENYYRFEDILVESNENILFEYLVEFTRFTKSRVITEQLQQSQGSAVGGLFSGFMGSAGGGVVQYFKTKLMHFVLEKLNIGEQNGFLRSIIANTFAEIEVKDLYRVITGDCKFISQKLAAGVVDGIIEKMLKDKGYDSPFVGIIFQTMSETIQNTEFISKLGVKLSTLVCEILSGLKSKVASFIGM
jgi:phage-related holin